MKKDLISIKDLKPTEIEDIFNLTDKLKKDKAKFSSLLKAKTLALVFQKPSCRTRVSFETGMYQLGGNSIYLGLDEINLGVRESIKDVAKTLSRYVDAVVLRTFSHSDIIEFARYASIPVINGLSDLLHPCQALGDVYTIQEKLGNLKKIILSYVGDGNNVCNSLLHICDKLGIKMLVGCPKGYEPEVKARYLFNNAEEAVKNADCIYTDVWTSMGWEKEAEKRKKIFKEFQINRSLLKLAKKDCLVMHCLPAHRGEEITNEVIDSKNSLVFEQAENRLHVQKAILIKLLK